MSKLRFAAAALLTGALGQAWAAPAPTFQPLAREQDGTSAKAALLAAAQVQAMPKRHALRASLRGDGSVAVACEVQHDHDVHRARLPGEQAGAEQPR